MSKIVIARGDGIGPEIMQAVLSILDAAHLPLAFQEIEIGEKVYKKGYNTGIAPSTWEILQTSDAFLKAPITTPQGGGFKSLNVSVRASLDLYANIRPCIAYDPFVATKHAGMDVVVVRENEEDLYTGVEYRHTLDQTYVAYKIISRAGCERIIDYAFRYALANGRKKVTAFTKDNILKLTDGLFHQIFDEIAAFYPEIEKEHWIIDIGAAKLADTPEAFDVIVMPNLYGDILSDVAAQIAGSVGLAGSANIGEKGAMFEAIHGSAPRRAGQDLANPSGLLLAAIQMLAYLGHTQGATHIHNAYLATLEAGIHTYDIYKAQTSKEKVGTQAFARAVIERLGEHPKKLKAASYFEMGPSRYKKQAPSTPQKQLVGADFFIDCSKGLSFIEKTLGKLKAPLSLEHIGNRGIIVSSQSSALPACLDQWRCRFKGSRVSQADVIGTLEALTHAGFDVVQVQNLYTFNGEAHFCFSR